MRMNFAGMIMMLVVLIGLAGCSEKSSKLVNPKPIKIVTVGSKIDGFGHNFQFFVRGTDIYYAYLDFIENKLIEGELSSDWTPVITREVSFEIEEPSIFSFLIYERRNEYNDILFSIEESTRFWSHREHRWKELQALTGEDDSRWFARPVRSQLPWEGKAFIRFGRRFNPPSYFKMDFLEGDLSLIAADSDEIWVVIGKWNQQDVLAKRKNYRRRLESSSVSSKWSITEFDVEHGRVGERILPPIRSRFSTRDARLVSEAVPNTVLIEAITGAWVYRLVNDRWEGRTIENVQLINMLRDETSSFNTHGGIDFVEEYGRIFVVYNSEIGSFLQIWDDQMTEFVEYWMGDFALGSKYGTKFALLAIDRMITFSKENYVYDEMIGHGIVDLVFREWSLDDFEEVRRGRFEDLELVEVTDLEKMGP